MRPTSIRTLDPGDGPSVSVVGDTYRVVASGEQTGGAFAVVEMLVPPGGGPGPHAHADMQETYYVTAGEVVFRSETQTYTAHAGAVVDVPRGGAVHSFTNESEAVARMVCVAVPAGIEAMFLEIGQPVEAGQFLPKPEMTSEVQAQMKAAAERYGNELFPPDALGA